MRLPHHLVRSSTGVLHFRQKVPLDLQSAFGLRVIKRSLGTRSARLAQAHAYVFSARVGALFDEARKLIGMNRSIPDHLLHMLHDDPDDSSYLKTWRVERTVNGFTLDMQGDSAKEHAQGMEVLKALLAADVTPMAVRSGGGIQGANAATVSAKAGITVGEATRKYLLTIDSALLPDKTRSQKRAAVNGFAQWKGLKKPLADCSRTDVAEWVQSLRVARLATPTLANKTSYLKAFFEWSQTAGYFPKGDNPAQGQVKYGVREKRLRRKLGFEAFTPEQLSVIYGPKFSTLRTEIQLGALLGLYTGARVSELGQLRLDDFVEEDGLPCIRISADGEGQSLKTDASARTLPLHPRLIEWGVLRHVESLRKAGQTRLFPRTKVGSVNGHGNFLSAAFGRYIKFIGIQPRAGKVGFHSLRKTVVQTMQSAGVPSEYRAQYVGHELGDEHHMAYSRQYNMSELSMKVHPALCSLAFGEKSGK